MDNEIRLDVSHLEPCEPLERALEAVEGLMPGQYICMQHRCEPFPLYNILDQRGFKYFCRQGEDTPFEIFIWKRGDQATQSLIDLIIKG